MTYRELLARLLPARRFGIVLGLERMRGLLDTLGAPERALGTIVHVGGTNGKGSTVALISSAWQDVPEKPRHPQASAAPTSRLDASTASLRRASEELNHVRLSPRDAKKYTRAT